MANGQNALSCDPLSETYSKSFAQSSWLKSEQGFEDTSFVIHLEVLQIS